MLNHTYNVYMVYGPRKPVAKQIFMYAKPHVYGMVYGPRKPVDKQIFMYAKPHV